MAQRLSCAILATVFFLVTVQSGAAQEPLELPPPNVPMPKAGAQPAGTERPAVGIDALIEKALNRKTEAHTIKTRDFKLPVNATDDSRSMVREFRLYVKAPSAGWTLHIAGSAETTQFICRMDVDGEHWFALAVVDKDGAMTVSDSVRVVVDTAQPKDPGLPPIPALPPPPPFPGTPPPVVTKSPEPPAPPKELTAEELDGLTEKAFGKNCAELKRPIRVYVADLGMLIAAEKAMIAHDGLSVRFASASAGVVEGPGDVKDLRADEMVVNVDKPVKAVSEVRFRYVMSMEAPSKGMTVTLTPITTAGPNAPPVVSPTPVFPPSATPTPRPFAVRFKFDIDPKMPLTDLLPAPAKTTAKLPHWRNEDLSKVPELSFGTQLARSMPKHQAVQATAHAMAKINHLNGKQRDGFLLAMLDKRSDLRGLPFRMGDDCRTREEQAKFMATFASQIRILASEEVKTEIRQLDPVDVLHHFLLGGRDIEKSRVRNHEVEHRAAVAAVTQILMPESEYLRVGMAKFLAGIPHLDATKALARLAIFAPEDSVRSAAIDGLKLRRDKDYTDILLGGLRYPLPAVAKRSAEAIVKLDRQDLLVNLIDVLESPDPRLPVVQKQDGKNVMVVREVVKVNHHKNCLLCHAPGNTENTPAGILRVAVPLPGEPMPKPAEVQYYTTPPPTPDIVVRLDMTYLRQDFSVMMPVSDAHPWPDMQRFDFLVRTREVTQEEAKAYVEETDDGRVSPYHRSALYALRELTGRDTEPTAAAWRKLLKLPR